jgi:tetratricopeptide (TPR) repeat protein
MNYMAAAECYMAGGKANRARKLYAMIQKDYLYYVPLPVLLEKLRELAQCYEEGRGTVLGLRDTLASIEIYRQIVALQPDVKQSLDDRLVLGAKLEKDGQNEEAVNVYQEIIRLAPKEPDPRLVLARLLSKMSAKADSDGELGRAAVREARSFLELASRKDPRRAEADGIVHDCREREASRLLERATFYLNKHHYRAEVARRYLYDIVREYPETHGALQASVILRDKFNEKGGGALPPPKPHQEK